MRYELNYNIPVELKTTNLGPQIYNNLTVLLEIKCYHFTGPNCTDCVKGWYSVNCSVNCVEVSGQYTCNSTTGDKVCETNWTGPQCDSCATNYYGSKCSTFCKAGAAWNCSDTGEKECFGHFTGQNCSLCKTGWFGGGCDLYCDTNSTLWTCDQNGNKTCTGQRTGIWIIMVMIESLFNGGRCSSS